MVVLIEPLTEVLFVDYESCDSVEEWLCSLNLSQYLVLFVNYESCDSVEEWLYSLNFSQY